MTFNSIARAFASAGTLAADDLRQLHAAANFAPADPGISEAIGVVGGSEISLARFIAAQCSERAKLERDIRAIVSGELRPAHSDALLWTISQQRGRPPQDIAGALGVLESWSLVADAVERRISPAKPATTGGNLHTVA